MPTFGGSLKFPYSRSSNGHSFMYGGLAVVALGLATCAVLLAGSLDRQDVNELASGEGVDSQLAKMQSEVQQQLVEAAKRRALAKKHREQALELATSAKEDRMMAKILKRKSAYSRAQSALKKDTDAVKNAEARIRKMKSEAANFNAASDKDSAKADDLKQEVLTLQDKAGALTEKAAEEDARVAVVKSDAAKEDASLPKLLNEAESTENKAAQLKRAAKARMTDSTLKMKKATKLDELAAEKEQEAHTIRSQLIGILSQKAAALAAREKTAAAEESLAKREAADAAKNAEHYASEAESKAASAHEATATVEDQQALAGEDDESSHTEAKKIERDLLEGRRRANLVRSALETERIRNTRKTTAAAHTAAEEKGSARLEGLAEKDDGAAAVPAVSADPDAVRENEDGRMVLVKAVAGPSTAHMKEDGHYSEREEAFKRALAQAYRSGYKREDELAQTDGAAAGGADAAQPARFEMLGPNGGAKVWGEDAEAPAGAKELLQKSAGATVQLEADPSAAAAAVQERSPLFTQLWYDPDSLPSVTSDLEGTTRRLSRYSPAGAAEMAQAAPEGGSEQPAAAQLQEESPAAVAAPARMETLYEDGHQSRAEEEFNKEMSKYRAALEQQRQADLEKARRAGEELRNLPGGGGGSSSGREATTQELERRGADLQEERRQVDAQMLGERGGENSMWEQARRPEEEGGRERDVEAARRRVEERARARREAAGVRVKEDDDGHLVIDDGRNGALDEFREDEREEGRERQAARDEGEGRERRMEEELHESLSREARLERRTERLEGEVEALTGRRPWRRHEQLRGDGDGNGREEMLSERPAAEVGRGGEEDGRRREEAPARGGEDAAHGRLQAKAARGGGGNFKPDETFEKEYAYDPGHVSVGEIKFQHALKDFDHTKAILRAGAAADSARFRLPQLIPSHLPGQGL